MTGVLMLDSLTRGNTLKQGDKTPLSYKLLDADGDKLSIAGKPATVRLVYPNYLTIGYEKSGLTVASDDTVTFTIDKIIPARKYHVEIIVDNKFVFPSRSAESKFTIDKSSLGAESNIIEIVGKEVLINAVKSKVDTELQPLVTSMESAQQAEIQRASAESSRVSAEEQREIDHANRSAELARKADKVIIRNLVLNSDFDDGLWQWSVSHQIASATKVVDGKLHVHGQNSGSTTMWPTVAQPTTSVVGHVNYFRIEVSEMASNSVQCTLQDRNRRIISVQSNGVHSAVRKIDSGQTLPNLYLNHVMEAGAVVDYKVDNIISIDLTETFGAGNEPTKEEMDNLINTIGHIDGTYRLDNKEMLGYLMNSVGDKANKKQEEWITPTLLNGWVTQGQVYNTPSYRKNQFGTVELKGILYSGAKNTTAFNLPVGYKPTSQYYGIARSQGLTIAMVDINVQGRVLIDYFGSGSGWVSLSNISFDTA